MTAKKDQINPPGQEQLQVVVGMSGGVDSSVAAALLKDKGYRLTGVTMKIWQGETSVEEGAHHACYGPGEEQDIEDARTVCRMLDIPFHVIDLREEYKTGILDYYCREYMSGRTPNPCFRCNGMVKFGALLDKARESGIEFDFFATGHYARTGFDERRGRYLLKKAADLAKDQSYFLSGLSQEQLAMTIFPLGNYTKTEVRSIAHKLGLPVDDKPESQDFIAGGYQSLLAAAPAGRILDGAGNVLGEHKGIPLYTIGQRRGLGISAGEPRYVIDIDPENNAVIVGSEADLYKDEFYASNVNWIAIENLTEPVEVEARIRYRHREARATISPTCDNSVHVKFECPQPAITPGQTAVFYRDDIVIGGGTISKAGE